MEHTSHSLGEYKDLQLMELGVRGGGRGVGRGVLNPIKTLIIAVVEVEQQTEMRWFYWHYPVYDWSDTR